MNNINTLQKRKNPELMGDVEKVINNMEKSGKKWSKVGIKYIILREEI